MSVCAFSAARWIRAKSKGSAADRTRSRARHPIDERVKGCRRASSCHIHRLDRDAFDLCAFCQSSHISRRVHGPTTGRHHVGDFLAHRLEGQCLPLDPPGQPDHMPAKARPDRAATGLARGKRLDGVLHFGYQVSAPHLSQRSVLLARGAP